ncbi:hypothetical protein [Tenacibaculum ovolyticum]|uniref:hypothetical protein n=1 Tax=Tenacibaculum ovolyticum TaxID=104270 RepID=UPI000AFBBBAB|nr:hypothetical protein [Tenacibaculum ovolyticum]
MKNLKEYSVEELSSLEGKKVNGGFWVELWGGFNFVRNFNDGYLRDSNGDIMMG